MTKRSKNLNPFKLCLIIQACALLSSCADKGVSLDSAAHRYMLEQKHSSLQEMWNTAGQVEVSYEQALERAVQSNLDVRVAALEILAAQDDIELEKLSALPEFKLLYNYSARSNEGASSSRSLLTGRESLEPSVSGDQYRNTADLDLRIKMIDIALAGLRASSADDRARIALERRQKVIHNIIQDVTLAYWNAYIFQEKGPAIRKDLKKARKQLEKLDQARDDDLLFIQETAQQKSALIDNVQNLKSLYDELLLAESELKALLSIPQDAKIILQKPNMPSKKDMHALLKADMEMLELQALQHRPEMREAILSENIAARDLRREVVRTLPGAELFVGFNYDSNSFLVDSAWKDFSLSVVQSISQILSLPARQRDARNRQEVEKARSLALTAAIITQVHLARHRLQLLQEREQIFAASNRAYADQIRALQARNDAGFTSGNEVLQTSLRAHRIQLEAMQSKASLHEAVIGLLTALGQPSSAAIPLMDEEAARI